MAPRTIPMMLVFGVVGSLLFAACETGGGEADDDQSADDLPAKFAEIMVVANAEMGNEITGIDCECEPERRGFDSTDDCRAYQTRSREELETVGTCVAEQLRAHPEPLGDSTEEALDCLDEVFEQMASCVAEIAEEPDFCDEADTAGRECQMEFQEGFQACQQEHFDSDVQTRLMDPDPLLDRCKAPVQELLIIR